MAEHSTILKLLNWITNSKNTKNKVFEAIFVFICIFLWRKLKLKWQRVPGFMIVFSLCFACFRSGLLWLFPYLWLYYLSYSLDFISRIINYLPVSFCLNTMAMVRQLLFISRDIYSQITMFWLVILIITVVIQ